MSFLIRNATNADALAISRIIIGTLRESNTLDYSSAIIDQVESSFSPSAILDLLTRRQVLVATTDSHIVATASLDKDVVRSVFVDPTWQGKGIGRQLMAMIQSIAIKDGVSLLRVPSSITAQGFYAALGFKKIRDEFHQSERTIIMAKTLEH
ncbi:GNAT family N-acetyltransferase [Pseudomonas sp. YuFO20]|uniref:GNAT family N-acetyltransferase n=1 Tax=Pseudomonas sp. YuFO20 TaxID=3095362 RepID=UPI002B2462B2|nr:GNAT family N-acetyltransferase [Pseudomonas sp. YuFO20]MEB2517664.1 GNAT family N-acetyltransferase [Pseudomonas sp. YuFO20]